jgi:hypothetical protein
MLHVLWGATYSTGGGGGDYSTGGGGGDYYSTGGGSSTGGGGGDFSTGGGSSAGDGGSSSHVANAIVRHERPRTAMQSPSGENSRLR